jgi:dienelactone hydrolase
MNLTKVVSCLIGVLLTLNLLGGCGSETSETTGIFVESEVSFLTEDSEIAGTLAVPEGEGPFPAVIVIAGSGAFDRNGDMDARAAEVLQAAGQPAWEANSTYRDIAEGLSRAGIITLRYDKREIGSSTGKGGDLPEPSLRDLGAAVTFLRDNPSVDAERIALVGHSLGGLWALMKAAEDPDIAAVCVMATPAKPWSEVIVEQIEEGIKLLGGNETEITQLEFVKALMDIAGADYAKEIRSPALILQGGKDLFTIIPEEAQLLKEAFNDGGNEEVELVVFANLDHLFRLEPGQPRLDHYHEDRGPVAAEVVDTIVDWMKDALR